MSLEPPSICVHVLACTILAALATGAPATPASAAASDAPADEPVRWSGSLEALTYLVDDPFVMPIASTDRGALHLEARYQYEDFNTASAWAGRRFTTGATVTLDVVAMGGVVFGGTTGLAPGLETSLSWKAFELYAETEYVLDLDQSAGNFLYTWSTLSWQATPWLAAGLAAQRSRTSAGEHDVGRGPFATLGQGAFALSVYGFDLDRADPYAIVGLGYDW